jgi:hypothetical protein
VESICSASLHLIPIFNEDDSFLLRDSLLSGCDLDTAQAKMIREGGHGGSGAVARGFQRGDNSRRAWQASSACLAQPQSAVAA